LTENFFFFLAISPKTFKKTPTIPLSSYEAPPFSVYY
jgi:hypothetical protein